MKFLSRERERVASGVVSRGEKPVPPQVSRIVLVGLEVEEEEVEEAIFWERVEVIVDLSSGIMVGGVIVRSAEEANFLRQRSMAGKHLSPSGYWLL